MGQQTADSEIGQVAGGLDQTAEPYNSHPETTVEYNNNISSAANGRELQGTGRGSF